MGLNLDGLQASLSLGIKAIKVEFSDFKMEEEILESSTTPHMSYFTTSQQALKKSTVKPSGPGTFPLAISLTATSTS